MAFSDEGGGDGGLDVRDVGLVGQVANVDEDLDIVRHRPAGVEVEHRIGRSRRGVAVVDGDV
jgi:hypothetical protein